MTSAVSLIEHISACSTLQALVRQSDSAKHGRWSIMKKKNWKRCGSGEKWWWFFSALRFVGFYKFVSLSLRKLFAVPVLFQVDISFQRNRYLRNNRTTGEGSNREGMNREIAYFISSTIISSLPCQVKLIFEFVSSEYLLELIVKILRNHWVARFELFSFIVKIITKSQHVKGISLQSNIHRYSEIHFVIVCN